MNNIDKWSSSINNKLKSYEWWLSRLNTNIDNFISHYGYFCYGFFNGLGSQIFIIVREEHFEEARYFINSGLKLNNRQKSLYDIEDEEIIAKLNSMSIIYFKYYKYKDDYKIFQKDIFSNFDRISKDIAVNSKVALYEKLENELPRKTTTTRKLKI